MARAARRTGVENTARNRSARPIGNTADRSLVGIFATVRVVKRINEPHKHAIPKVAMAPQQCEKRTHHAGSNIVFWQ
jgi:hypothetical protein